MMPLRVAKKIFNRVSAYELELRLEFDSFLKGIDNEENLEYTLQTFHRMAVSFCGYTEAQVQRSLIRLQRSLRWIRIQKYGKGVSLRLI